MGVDPPEEGTIDQATTPSSGPRAAPRAGPGRAGWLGLTRSADDRVIAGVAAGVGERLSVDPVVVRVAFAVLAAAGGAGLVLYLLLWAVTGEPERAPRPWRPPASQRRAIAFGLQALGVLLLLRATGWWFGDAIAWPLALTALGSAVIWARSGREDRERWARLAARVPAGRFAALLDARVARARLAAGAALVAAGMVAFLTANTTLVTAWSLMVAGLAVVAGLMLVLGPGLWRLRDQLVDERRARIRSQERAEMAAHLHDSVLHTLALIQRTSDPVEATSLARGQERELRAWLAGRAEAGAGRLATAVDALAGRVERLHRVPVEAVVVGDAGLDERVQALVDATGEAAANAARHAKAPAVSVYVEVEADAIVAYVRDEGCGFDPSAVPAGRRGIAESITGRMTRNGGSTEIASEPGEGTEVTLHLPRRA
jgi:signal transduction histidine kinase